MRIVKFCSLQSSTGKPVPDMSATWENSPVWQHKLAQQWTKGNGTQLVIIESLDLSFLSSGKHDGSKKNREWWQWKLYIVFSVICVI